MFCLFFCFLKRKSKQLLLPFFALFRTLTPKNIIIFNNTRVRKNKNNNVIRLREQSDVLFFSLLLQKIFIVSSERSAFKLLLVEEF